jgi:hypothetical protein
VSVKIKLLAAAFDDLAAGREFYEMQGEGVGS